MNETKVATSRMIQRNAVVYADKWVIATQVDVYFDNGRVINDFLLVEMIGKGHVLVSARTTDGNFLFAHQCKPVAGMSVESVAGGCPTDVEHENQVITEMIEEIGYKPGKLVRLNQYGFLAATDRIDNRCHIFLAFDCEPTCEVLEQDEKQGVQILSLSPAEVWRKIKSGEIKDTATLAGIFAHFLYESGGLHLP